MNPAPLTARPPRTACLLLVLVGGLGLAFLTGCPGPGVTIVDADGDVGRYNALAVGAGTVGIAYYDADRGGLKYTSKPLDAGTGWAPPVVIDAEGDVGRFVSLRMDSSGFPRVSYHDRTHGALKYAEQTPAGWNVQTVASSGATGLHTSLALDRHDRPWISFYDYGRQRLMIARRRGAGWRVGPVGPTPLDGIHGRLVLDPVTGAPGVLFIDLGDQAVRYAARRGHAWTVTTVDPRGPFQGALDLKVDPGSGTLLATYCSTGHEEIRVARRNGEAWEVEIVASDAMLWGRPALAVVDGDALVAYSRANRRLVVAARTDLGWDERPIDGVFSYFFGPPSMSAIRGGKFCLSYHATKLRQLRFYEGTG